MSANHNLVKDTTIVSMLAENNRSVWEHVYDKYGSMMFGTICDMTGNQMMAEELFEEAFYQLMQQGISGYNSTSIGLCLYRYSYTFIKEQLKIRGLKPKPESNPLFSNCHLLKLLWTESLTLKEAGEKLNLSEKAARKKLQEEFELLNKEEQEYSSGGFKLAY